MSAIKISIHAPREGGDPVSAQYQQQTPNFNPRPPRGGRHSKNSSFCARLVFQSTPPARGATIQSRTAESTGSISIHAPREGGDYSMLRSHRRGYYFNPRPPRGGRPQSLMLYNLQYQFQSTPPARGATQMSCTFLLLKVISIHAPREGGDRCRQAHPAFAFHFNPRPPRGGRLSTA